MEFSQLQLKEELLRALRDAGYTEPSPIQDKAIPPVLDGRDVLACAQTGTGKTAAFALPTLQLLSAHAAANAPAPRGGGKRQPARPVRCLVLTPTRELALQIFESFEKYGKYLPLKSAVVFGGVGQQPQVDALRAGVDILVATPGRLKDLINQGHADIRSVEIFVLDEADRMLDMGFAPDVKKLIAYLPKKRQTLLFSATIPNDIAKLAASILHEPVRVYATPPSTVVESVSQCVYKVDKLQKRHLLAALLRDGTVDRALVFTRTKHGADRVARDLTRDGIKAMAIHGNKSQTARQAALSLFKNRKIRVLIATDIAARGLDIPELSHVFNYELPNVPETYVHRIGRTGRAGHTGKAVSFCMPEELPFLADIEKLAGFSIPEEQHSLPAAPPAQDGHETGQKQHNNPLNFIKSNVIEPISQAQKPADKEGRNKKKPDEKAGRQNVQAAAQPARSGAPAEKGAARQPKRAKKEPARNAAQRPQEQIRPDATAAKNIVTKRPVWSAAPAQQGENGAARPTQGKPAAAGTPSPGNPRPQGAAGQPPEGDDSNMSRNKRRRGGSRAAKGNRSPEAPPKGAVPQIPKNANGVFDFSEAELSEDNAIQVISRSNTETKYASFEDFLKDH